MFDWTLLAPIVVGAVLGYLLKGRGDAATWRHDNLIRWQADKRAAYARFLAATAEFQLLTDERVRTALAAQIFREVRPGASIELPDVPSRDAMELAQVEIELMAPWSIGVHAKMLNFAVFALAGPARVSEPVWLGVPDFTGDEYKERTNAVDKAREHFLEAAREDLGVEDWPSPPQPWHRRLRWFLRGQRIGRLRPAQLDAAPASVKSTEPDSRS